jgi:hypothetical protein
MRTAPIIRAMNKPRAKGLLYIRLLESYLPYISYISSLIMEAVRTSETSVDNHFTRQYNPEDNSEHHAWTSLVPTTPRCAFGMFVSQHLITATCVCMSLLTGVNVCHQKAQWCGEMKKYKEQILYLSSPYILFRDSAVIYISLILIFWDWRIC